MSGPGGIPDADWALAQQYGSLYGVDPLLLVAIGIHETGWGTTGLGRKGLTLGVGAFDSGPTYKWAGTSAQLQEGAKLLAQHGVKSVADVRTGKATFWATDPDWASAVANEYDKLSGTTSSGLNAETAGFTTGATSVVKALTKLADPEFWRRIGKFVLGFAVVVMSIWFLIPKNDRGEIERAAVTMV
jgi:hypothetical protein